MKIEPIEDQLKLTNEGGLSFFFVGVGSAFSKVNYQTNLLIIKGQDHLLVDCGTSCPYALYSYKSNITSIKNFLITHSHADHIGGLEEAALMGRYVTKVRPNMVITNEYKKLLWNQSLRGGNSYGEYTDGGYLVFDDYFTQIKPKTIKNAPRPFLHAKIGSIDVKMYRTKHIPDSAGSWKNSFYSNGILIDDRILFPSDTRFDKELFDWLLPKYPTIEYIFHDCQFYPGGVHASYSELASLPADVKKRIYLCHYGDNYAKFDAIADGFAGFTQQGVYYNFDK